MTRRSHFLLAAALGMLAAAACSEQPAGPPDTTPTDRTTGTLRVPVLRDIANAATRTLQPGVGIRVAIFTLDDTINPIRTVAADTVGPRLGGENVGTPNAFAEALFPGLKPGTYIVKLQTAALTEFIGGRTADTVIVSAGHEVNADQFQVRLGAVLSGVLSDTIRDQNGVRARRLAGVKIYILRQRISTDTGTYDVIDSVTTDATGSYSLPVTAGPTRFRLRFDTAAIHSLHLSDSLTLRGTAVSRVGAPPGFVNVTLGTVNPGATVAGGSLAFTFAATITGVVFRDTLVVNNTRDSTSSTVREGLFAGDTVSVQLRDSTKNRVIGTAVRVFGSATPNSPTFTFPGVQGGKYFLVVDCVASRFPVSFPYRMRSDTIEVNVPNSATSVRKDIPLRRDPGVGCR